MRVRNAFAELDNLNDTGNKNKIDIQLTNKRGSITRNCYSKNAVIKLYTRRRHGITQLDKIIDHNYYWKQS